MVVKKLSGQRPIGRFMLLFAALLLASSCVTMEIESEFNEDGSATHSMAVSIDTSMLEGLGGEEELNPDEGFEELEEAAEAEGYRVEQIDEDGVVGVRITTDVEDNSDLGAVINGIFNTDAAEGEMVNAFSGSFEEDDGTYRLELTVDGDELMQGAGEDLGGGELTGFDPSQIFEMTYIASLPGEIDEDETNGTVLDDGRVQWDLPLSGSETLVAQSSTSDDGLNLALLVVIGIIVLGLLAAIVVALVIFMGRRGTGPAQTAPPSAASAPQDTIPQPFEGGGPPMGQVDPHAPRDVPPADQPTQETPQGEDDDQRPGQ